jgi:hypothetical protein
MFYSLWQQLQGMFSANGTEPLFDQETVVTENCKSGRDLHSPQRHGVAAPDEVRSVALPILFLRYI